MINVDYVTHLLLVRKRMVVLCVLALVLSFGSVIFADASAQASALVGPKKFYLALGDSLAFSYQPNVNYDDGYVDDFQANLKMHGGSENANLGCPGETSVTMLNGKCPVPILRKFPYIGSQLAVAVGYLKQHAGQVSPVTLDIGANDVLPDINSSTCAINTSKFAVDLATLDKNLTQTILPALHAGLLVNGQVTGDLVMMNLYDPYQSLCPATLPYLQVLNQHLANDAAPYGRIANVFAAFGGTARSNICSYTWQCSKFKDVHPNDQGYSVIAAAFEGVMGY